MFGGANAIMADLIDLDHQFGCRADRKRRSEMGHFTAPRSPFAVGLTARQDHRAMNFEWQNAARDGKLAVEVGFEAGSVVGRHPHPNSRPFLELGLQATLGKVPSFTCP